jgi:hypothetical protein
MQVACTYVLTISIVYVKNIPMYTLSCDYVTRKKYSIKSTALQFRFWARKKRVTFQVTKK